MRANGAAMTLGEIAQAEGITHQAVSQILSRAMRKLRRNRSVMRELRGYQRELDRDRQLAWPATHGRRAPMEGGRDA